MLVVVVSVYVLFYFYFLDYSDILTSQVGKCVMPRAIAILSMSEICFIIRDQG